MPYTIQYWRWQYRVKAKSLRLVARSPLAPPPCPPPICVCVKPSTGHTHTGHTNRENTPDTGKTSARNGTTTLNSRSRRRREAAMFRVSRHVPCVKVPCRFVLLCSRSDAGREVTPLPAGVRDGGRVQGHVADQIRSSDRCPAVRLWSDGTLKV